MANIVSKSTKQDPNGTRSVLGDTGLPQKRIVKKPRRLSYGFQEYGYTTNTVDGNPIPAEYLVRITSYRNKCTIVAPMQEDININITSSWEPLVPTSILRVANMALQAGSGGSRSAITSSTTRRMWSGTSPLGITLKLKFEAVKDAFYEVVEPCRLLQSMTVPSDPATSRKPFNASGFAEAIKNFNLPGAYAIIEEHIGDLPALRPPGPTPFVWDNLFSGQTNWTDKSRSDIEKSAEGGDFIIVELGTFLTFWSVIIRENGVVYKTKFDRNGDPVSAETEVRFETYEMPTKESLEYSYTKVKVVPTEM